MAEMAIDLEAEQQRKASIKKSHKTEKIRRMKRNKWLYAMVLPGFIYFFIFRYLPMVGVVISFKRYKPYEGILGSEWVGMQNFQRLFNDPDFYMIFKNTIVLFGMNMLIYFPIPIIISLLLNEVRVQFFKRTVQSLIYIPHFMSWVIIASISYVMLTRDGGIINDLLVYFGFEKINFLMNEFWFRPMYIIQVIWREAGWGTIIYLAAIASVDPQLYEAARIDGANRTRQIWHITLPSIRGVIVVLVILRIGDVLELGFEHIYLLLNGMNRSVAEIFDTYIYVAGILQQQYSYATAVGFFRAFVGLGMVVLANWLANKFGEEGVY